MEDDKKPAAVAHGVATASSLEDDMWDDDSTVPGCADNIAPSPVARKRPVIEDDKVDNGNDDDDRKPAATRRSQRIRLENIFFDPGNGEPDSRWRDRGSGVTMDGSSINLEDGEDDDDEEMTLVIGDETVIVPNERITTTFPDQETTTFVAAAKRAWMLEMLCDQTFKFLDEIQFKSRIRKHVKAVIIDIAMNDSQILDAVFKKKEKTFPSWRAARQEVAKLINAKDLGETLAKAVWNAINLHAIHARVISNILNYSETDDADETDDDYDNLEEQE